jgi:hypothetical protein
MGSKGFIVTAIAVILFASCVISALAADLEPTPPRKEVNCSSYSSLLQPPSDLNPCLFKCRLMADLRTLETTAVWEMFTPDSIDCCSKKMTEFEGRLRDRAQGMDAFEHQLEMRWPSFSDQERINLTRELECLLRKQAGYLYEFQVDLKKIWCFLPKGEKKKFKDSYEDLLKRESRLLLKFEDFLHKQQQLPEDRKISFLQSFEGLIRKEAVLLDTFEDFLKVNCDVLEITKTVCTCCPKPGESVNYTYNITNKADYPIKEIAIIDSRLNVVAAGLRLGPHETKFINASTVLEGRCLDIICNKAMVLGEDPKGFVLHNTSKDVCVQLTCPVVKGDSIKVGLQRSMAVGSERAKAQNVVKIEGDQRNKCPSCSGSNNSSKMEADNRSPAACSC